MTNTIKTLIKGSITSKTTLNYDYRLLSINTKLQKDQLELKDTYLSYPKQGMTVKLPISYLNETCVAVVNYALYPFLTEQGDINYLSECDLI